MIFWGVWLGGLLEGKLVKPECFLLKATIMFFPQIVEKIEEKTRKCHFVLVKDQNTHVTGVFFLLSICFGFFVLIFMLICCFFIFNIGMTINL